jgi:hypothetical protein
VILRLWALAWAARYLKYLPILGWRFSETIVQRLEDRMERDVAIDDAALSLADSPPCEATLAVTATNELPVDLTVAAVDVRLGYSADGDTVANVCWSQTDHGPPPANVTRSQVASGDDATVTVERHVPTHPDADSLHADGTITTRAWLDLRATRRIPLGTLDRDLPDATVAVPATDDDPRADQDGPREDDHRRGREDASPADDDGARERRASPRTP